MTTDLKLKKSGRICYAFPWFAQSPQPWKSGYSRVVIPLTAAESINSNKKCHIQIVKSSNLTTAE